MPLLLFQNNADPAGLAAEALVETCRGWGTWRHRCLNPKGAAPSYLCTVASDYGSTPRPTGCNGLYTAGIPYDTDDEPTDSAKKSALADIRVLSEAE